MNMSLLETICRPGSTATIHKFSAKFRAPFNTKPSIHQRCVVKCSAGPHDPPMQVDRRGLMLGLAASSLLSNVPMSFADDESEMKTFFGLATPPTSYGGYGGNANESPKYAFEYPAFWKTDVINKVQKGTQGIDGRVYNPRNKTEQVFVITLSRAGEDSANFRLTDIDSTFQGFAGADYDLLEALSNATDKVLAERTVNGQRFYDVEVKSPDVNYLSSITVSQGKVYAMFVKAPIKLFQKDEDKLRGILTSFRIL